MLEQVKRCSTHIDVNILLFFSTQHIQLTIKMSVHAVARSTYVRDELALRTP